MKFILILSYQIFSFSLLYAGADSSVIIRGKIGGSFDKNYTRIIDSFGQEFYVPTRAFPKDYIFKQGKDFQIEIQEEELKQIKLKKK